MKSKILLLLKVAGRWSTERSEAKDARAKAGWTSVRIDKATFAKLHAMARQLPNLAEPAAHYVTPYAMTELLALLANAEPVALEGMHACPDPRVHADAGKLVDAMKAKVSAEILENPLYSDAERRALADFWEWLVPDILSLRVLLQGVHASNVRRRTRVHASDQAIDGRTV